MASPIEGIYVAYLTGKAGTGFAMLIIRNGKITGADPLGAVYDGIYSKKPDNNYNVKLKSVLPPNIPLIQGGQSSPGGEVTELDFDLECDFEKRDHVRVNTTRGPVNAKLIKLRAIDD